MMLNQVPNKWLDTEDRLDGTGTLGSELELPAPPQAQACTPRLCSSPQHSSPRH